MRKRKSWGAETFAYATSNCKTNNFRVFAFRFISFSQQIWVRNWNTYFLGAEVRIKSTNDPANIDSVKIKFESETKLHIWMDWSSIIFRAQARVFRAEVRPIKVCRAKICYAASGDCPANFGQWF